MKMQIKSIFAICSLVIFTMTGCSKNNDDSPNPVTGAKAAESPVASLLATSGYKVSELDFTPEKGGEFGFLFSPNVNGKISQLGCKMPETGVYTVTLWDDNTSKIIRQKTIEQTAPSVAVLVDIEALAVIKDKRYVVSVNLTSGSKIKKTYRLDIAGGFIQFPKNVGSMLLLAPKSIYKVASPTFPDGGDALTNLSIFGLPDVTFIPE